MSSQINNHFFNLQSLLALQAILVALLAYLVIRTHEYFPEENSLVFLLKFTLLVLVMILMALDALA